MAHGQQEDPAASQGVTGVWGKSHMEVWGDGGGLPGGLPDTPTTRQAPSIQAGPPGHHQGARATPSEVLIGYLPVFLHLPPRRYPLGRWAPLAIILLQYNTITCHPCRLPPSSLTCPIPKQDLRTLREMALHLLRYDAVTFLAYLEGLRQSEGRACLWLFHDAAQLLFEMVRKREGGRWRRGRERQGW